MMHDVQKEFPPGLKIENELPPRDGDKVPGQLFRVSDSRIFPESPVTRFARLLEKNKTSLNWFPLLHDRVKKLVELEIPYVHSLFDVIILSNGDILYLEQSWSTSLEDKILADKGVRGLSEVDPVFQTRG